MKTLAKTLVAAIALTAFVTPAHAEISNPGTKKVVKVKSFKAKKVKFLTTSANLETTTATPAPTTPVTPPALDPNTVMMAKLMELVKALVDSNSAALAALKQPGNSVVTTVNPVITVNPTVSSVNQQVQAPGTPVTLNGGANQPSISLGHNDENEGHR